MGPLIRFMRQDSDFQSTVKGLEENLQEQLVVGLSGTARAVYVASIYQETKRPVLLITHNLNQAQKVVEDLQELLPKEEVLLYPANELVTTEIALASQETLGERMQVLSQLSRGFSGVVVVPFSGVRKLLPPKSVMQMSHIELEVGRDYPIDQFRKELVDMGYEPVDMVEKIGEFSARGGIVDVFPVTFEHPIRIEWFDETIDSIRFFSVQDQRSFSKEFNITIPPAKELFANQERLRQTSSKVEKLLEEFLSKTKDPELVRKLQNSIQSDIERMKEGECFVGIYKYISQIYPDYQSLLDYMPSNKIVILDELTRIIESAKQMEKEEAEWQTALLSQGEFMPSLTISFSYEDLFSNPRFQRIYLSLFMRHVSHAQPQNIVQLICRNMQQFHGQMHVLKTEWDRC